MVSNKKGSSENVQVVVRLRPLSEKERKAGHEQATAADLSSNSISVTVPDTGDSKTWTFDQVFTDVFTQRDIYLQVAHPVVESVINGYNATIFAYGQSGTGKTYTMTGRLDKQEEIGIIPNALNHIFSVVSAVDATKKEYTIQVSYLELYNGQCRDLLVENKHNLEIKENSHKVFYVKDLSMWDVKDAESALRLMDEGLTRREVKATELNADSSRSHSIFAVHVKCYDVERDVRTESKLNLVDLAGSERQSKTQAQGEVLKEGSNINLSLTALGGVIDCIVKGRPHIPYRSSPLTMLLKDALGGGSRTLLFGNVGPAEHNAQETISTLRFVDRAKQIKNKPKVQMDAKDARIMELIEENKELKRRLGMLDDDSDDNPDDDTSGVEDTRTAVSAESGAARRRRTSGHTSWDSELNQLKRRVDELEVALESSESENQRLREDTDMLERANRKSQEGDKAMQEVKESLDSLERDLALRTAELDDQRATVKELLDVALDALLTTLSESDRAEWQSVMSDPQSTLDHTGSHYLADVLLGLRYLRDGAVALSNHKQQHQEGGGGLGKKSKSGKRSKQNHKTESEHHPTPHPPASHQPTPPPSTTERHGSVSSVDPEARRELENALQSLECQRSIAAKAKEALDAKTDEAVRLKEHVNVLRDELKKTREQHIVELQETQGKLVLQTNKKIEKLVLSHQAAVAKEARQREKLQEKVKRVKEKMQALEQDYDVKVLENDQLLRDIESMKVEHLKKLKDWGMFSPVSASCDVRRSHGIQSAAPSAPPPVLPSLGDTARSINTQPTSMHDLGVGINSSGGSTGVEGPTPPQSKVPPSMFSRNFLDITKR
eukprot:PhM_4_TR9130/c0_g1_i1/m.7566/K10394/KIF3A; kinesin family member 3A